MLILPDTFYIVDRFYMTPDLNDAAEIFQHQQSGVYNIAYLEMLFSLKMNELLAIKLKIDTCNEIRS